MIRSCLDELYQLLLYHLVRSAFPNHMIPGITKLFEFSALNAKREGRKIADGERRAQIESFSNDSGEKEGMKQ